MKEEKTTQLRICGRAGQGVLMLGGIFGYAALLQGKFVAVSPMIGPEPRGGISCCDVTFSNLPIDFPRVRQADVLLALSSAAYERYISSLGKDGCVFYDPLFVRCERRTRHYAVPAAQAAEREMKTIFPSNIAFLSCVARAAKIVSIDAFTKALRAISPPKALAVNLKAADLGMRLAKKVKYP